MANRIVTATVTGETIKLSDKNAGAAGSFNAVSLALTFDSAWDDTTKKLYFFDSFYANPVYILLTVDYYNSETGVYTVPIPAEPLAYAGNMTITIKGVDFATDGTTTERIIMSASTEMKVASAIIPSTDTAPAEPTPTQAEQLQGEIDGIITDIAAIPAAVTAAQNSATAASGSATAAAQSATDAETAQGLAEAAQASTEATAAAFDSNATAKTTAFNDNATSKTSVFDLNAANANATIDGKVTTATNAATSAQAAQTAAEGARDLATYAKTAAELAETNAETAQGLAEAAKTAAELAETHAETAETNAGTHATNASNSASAAAGSATDANASKLAAQTAQTNAETAETNAETAEANATAKAVLAESYAKGGTGTRAGEDTDNALYYKNQAQEIVGGDYPTKTEAQGYVDTHDASATAHATLFGNKADKVAPAAAGNFAGLATDGSLQDSGKQASDFAAAEHAHDDYAAKGENIDITSLSGLTTPLSVAQGGTGSTAFSDASIPITDTTATALGLNPADDPQVKDALTAIIPRLVSTRNYWWEKYALMYVESLGNSTTLTDFILETQTITYYDSISVNPTTGEITYGTSHTYTFTGAPTTILNGKYFVDSAILYKGYGGTTVTNPSGYVNIHSISAYPVTATQTRKGDYIEDVSNALSTAHPSSGIQDGYYYVYAGKAPGAHAAVGSYTGTGTYGESNPNSFVFTNIVPKFMVVANSGNLMIIPCFALTTTYATVGVSVHIVNGGSTANSWHGLMCKKSTDGKTIYWYNTASADNQLNTSAAVYSPMGIG